MGMPLEDEFRFVEQDVSGDAEYPIKKIPTGVPDFDQIIRGGMPTGSVVLLLGEDGAGNQEYAYTSIAKIGIAKKYPTLSTYFLGTENYDVLPAKICYITFSRSRDDILQEVGSTFNYDYFSIFRDNVVFKDFSSDYFRNTIVPSAWTKSAEEEEPIDLQEALGVDEEKSSLLEDLVSFLDLHAKDSMVIIDSLTDLVTSNAINVRDLVTALKGLRRAAKHWDGIVYLLLAQDIMEKREQKMLVDSVDGVLTFEWARYHKSSKRQRHMYVEKFSSILAHLERKRIAKFPLMITSKSGMVIVNLELIA
jgi:KaiC/GvpD/RAD55 family RecA-like ATPase